MKLRRFPHPLLFSFQLLNCRERISLSQHSWKSCSSMSLPLPLPHPSPFGKAQLHLHPHLPHLPLLHRQPQSCQPLMKTKKLPSVVNLWIASCWNRTGYERQPELFVGAEAPTNNSGCLSYMLPPASISENPLKPG